MCQMNKSDVLKCYEAGDFFKNAELVGIDLSHIRLAKADFSEANLQFAEFNDTDLSESNFNYADLSNADLSGAILRNAFLVGANLTNANLEQADLRGAFLGGSTLCSTNFRDADLKDAIIGSPNWIVPDAFSPYTDFEGANLEGTTFGETTPKGVSMLGAKFTSAYLYEVNFSESVYYPQQLEEAITNKIVR